MTKLIPVILFHYRTSNYSYTSQDNHVIIFKGKGLMTTRRRRQSALFIHNRFIHHHIINTNTNDKTFGRWKPIISVLKMLKNVKNNGHHSHVLTEIEVEEIGLYRLKIPLFRILGYVTYKIWIENIRRTYHKIYN